MGLNDTEAVILRTYKLAEADKIVICLTKHAGLVRGVARGARRLKSRFGASLEPFTLVSLSYFEKEGSELVAIRQAEILRSYFNLAQSTETVAALEYFSELILEFAPPHEPNEKLFRLVKACVEAVALARAELHAIVRYFEIWTLRLSGFLPDMRMCAGCGSWFSGNEIVYVNAETTLRCGTCAGGMGTPLSSETQAQMRAIQRVAPTEWARDGSRAPLAVKQELAHVTQSLITRVLERAPRGQGTFISTSS